MDPRSIRQEAKDLLWLGKVLVIFLAISTLALADPQIHPVCDAEMIATYAPTMTKEEYRQVIDLAYGMGAIDSKYHRELLALIEEAYRQKGLDSWVREKCGEHGQ